MRSGNLIVFSVFFSFVAFAEGFTCGSLVRERNVVRSTPRKNFGSAFLTSSQPKIFTNKLPSSNTELFMSDNPTSSTEMEELRRKDPLKYVAYEIRTMDVNAFFNTAIIVMIALGAISKLATVDSSIMRGWTPSEMAYRIPVDNWLGYSEILDKSPISTKAITSATVYTIGDFIAQRTEGSSMGELDRPRMLRSLLAGLIGHGPLSHVWYQVSENFFDNVLHLTEWWSVFPKVAIDQTTWGPFWNNTYILLLGLMKRDSLPAIWSEMKRTTIPLILSGLKLWPLAHCITYGVIPVENRLLWVDLVEILWVVILASAVGGEGTHSALPEGKDEQKM